MSTRTKWIACLVAFSVGGLIASIPAFLDGPARSAARPRPSYTWMDKLPAGGPTAPEGGTIARTDDGRRLFASRIASQVCLTLQNSGGACVVPDLRKPIAVIGRDRGSGRTTWYGIVSDDVRFVRVSYDGFAPDTIAARRGFALVTDKRPLVFQAVDDRGRERGHVAGDQPIIDCSGDVCSITVTANS